MPNTHDYVGTLVQTEAGLAPRFGYEREPAKVMPGVHFDRMMDDVEHARRWVPMELVGYLSEHRIPIPRS